MGCHVPLRTCVGCRAVAGREQLVRLVRDQRGVLAFDPRGSAPGRGAWLHPDRECLATAVRKGAFFRALRGRVALVPAGVLPDPGGAAPSEQIGEQITERLWATLCDLGAQGRRVTDGTNR